MKQVRKNNSYFLSVILCLCFSLPANALAPSTKTAQNPHEKRKRTTQKMVNFLLQEGELQETVDLIKDPTLKQEIESDLFLKAVDRQYQQLINKTPPYYLFLLERAVMSAKRSFFEIAEASGNPAEIANVILKIIENGNNRNGPIHFKDLINLLPVYRQALVKAYSEEAVLFYWQSVKRHYLEEQKKFVPDIVFRPEAALVFNHQGTPYVYLGNFTSKHNGGTRVAEVPFNRDWFKKNGYEVIEIPEKFPFEGGADTKYVKHGERLTIIFGWGFRTMPETIDWILEDLKSKIGNEFNKIDVVRAHMISEEAYHLDTALKEIPVIDKKGNIVNETIMYYPDVFDQETQAVFKKKFPDALIISKKDVQNFASNSITIGKTIILDSRVSKALEEELTQRGMTVKRIELLEFYKAGGGAKCLVCELDKSPYSLDQEENKYFLLIESPRGVFDVQYVNDPYMQEMIGAINKGKADKEHENLIRLIQESGGDVQFLKTDTFRSPYDFQALFSALVAIIRQETEQSVRMKALFKAFGKNYIGVGDILTLYLEKNIDVDLASLESQLKKWMPENKIEEVGGLFIIDALFKFLLEEYNRFYYSESEFSYNAIMIATYKELLNLVNGSHSQENFRIPLEIVEIAL